MCVYRNGGGKTSGMTATKIYQSHTIFPVQQAPPVGSYNVSNSKNNTTVHIYIYIHCALYTPNTR